MQDLNFSLLLSFYILHTTSSVTFHMYNGVKGGCLRRSQLSLLKRLSLLDLSECLCLGT